MNTTTAMVKLFLEDMIDGTMAQVAYDLTILRKLIKTEENVNLGELTQQEQNRLVALLVLHGRSILFN